MSKIGVFDSGIGGLSVLTELIKTFPENHFIYISDEGYFPYGIKTKEDIIERGERIVSFLEERRVDLIVIACNTMSSVGLAHLKENHKTYMVGVIDGAVKKAVSITKNKRIGVISTPLTKKSHIYRDKIKSLLKDAEVIEIGSQELVNIVENGRIEENPVFPLAKRVLSPLIGIDTLILGCTHFPPLEEVIRRILKDVNIVDPAEEIAFNLKGVVRNGSIQKFEFLTTGDKDSFKKKAKVFIKDFNFPVKRIHI